MKKMLLLGALLVTVAFGVMACARTPAKTIAFTATNVGTQTMRSVVVHITGKSYEVGDIAAGTSKSVALAPGGDSHVELALSGHPRLVVDCYFSAGYTGAIAVEVTADKVIAVNDALVFGAY